MDVGNTNADLFEDFARHGVLGALARLDETGKDRMLTGAPYGLAAENAVSPPSWISMITAGSARGKHRRSAIRVGTGHHMAGFAAFGRTAADPAEAVSVLPGRHGAGVGQHPCFLSRQQRPNFPQVAIGSELGERWRLVMRQIGGKIGAAVPKA